MNGTVATWKVKCAARPSALQRPERWQRTNCRDTVLPASLVQPPRRCSDLRIAVASSCQRDAQAEQRSFHGAWRSISCRPTILPELVPEILQKFANGARTIRKDEPSAHHERRKVRRTAMGDRNEDEDVCRTPVGRFPPFGRKGKPPAVSEDLQYCRQCVSVAIRRREDEMGVQASNKRRLTCAT